MHEVGAFAPFQADGAVSLEGSAPDLVFVFRRREAVGQPGADRAVRGAGEPKSSDSTGRRNISKDTRQLTGLPGKPRNGTPSNVPIPCGPPGCIATWTNSVAWPSMAWRTTS